MPREMHGSSLQIPNSKHFIVVEKLVESILVFRGRDAVSLPKPLLYLVNAPSYTNRRPASLPLLELLLEICCGGQVVGVRVCFEDPVDSVTLLLCQSEQGVCGRSGDGLYDGVVV